MGTTRAWGLGLVALGAVLGGLLVLWTLTQLLGGQLRPGGFVLFLVLLAVIVVPLVGGGYYLMRHSAAEAVETSRFQARQRVLEGDRLFRADAAASLQRIAERLGAGRADQAAAAARLRSLATSVAQTRRDEAAWYESSPLADEDLPTLQRYEDALQVESDRLAELAARPDAADGAAITAAIDRWERAYRYREALLVRGRRRPGVTPEALLRARTPTRGAAALNALTLGDAVTVDFEDYLVQGVLSYFAEGRTWRVFILRDGDVERWLWSAPGGLTWAVLEPVDAAPAAGAASIEVESVALALAESGSATVDLTTVAGAERGVAVDYWRYTGPDRRLGWVERWPRETRAAVGRETFPDSIDVWPQTAPAADA
jgi:hypothetical protein